MKKLMALMMAGMMFFGTSPVTAFAAGDDTVETQNTVTIEEKTQDVDETVKEQLEMKTDKDGNITFSFGDWEWTLPKDTDVKKGTVVDLSSYLHLRSGAGMKYNIIGHLLPGAEVNVVGEEGDWYKVVVPEQNGYVHKDYLKVAEAAKNGEVNENTLAMVLYMMMQSMNDNAGVSLTPDGNLTLVDDIGSSTKAGQQFITFVSKNGNTFYMIIDRNDKGEENVHFLNLVDERDLLALMEEEEAAQYQKLDKPVEEPVVEQPTEAPDEKEKEPEKKSTPVLPLMLLFLAGAGGVGGFLYIKMKDKKKTVATEQVDPDADYHDDDDDAYEIPDEDEDNDEEDEYEEYDNEVEE